MPEKCRTRTCAARIGIAARLPRVSRLAGAAGSRPFVSWYAGLGYAPIVRITSVRTTDRGPRGASGRTTVSEADRERWNAKYKAGKYAARLHPSALLAAWMDRLPRGRALDVACGLGRNAIHLAAHGYAVDAMDISGVALSQARERARAAGVEVNWIETDLEQPHVARDAYDVIVVARFLDRPLIPRLIDALRPGGHVVYDHHYITPVEVGGPKGHRFRARPNELLERFRALRVLFYEEGVTADPDGSCMALARLVACKGSPGY